MFQLLSDNQSSSSTSNLISPLISNNQVIDTNEKNPQNNFQVKVFKQMKKKLDNNQSSDTASLPDHVIEFNSQHSLSFKCENKNNEDENNSKVLSNLDEIKSLLKSIKKDNDSQKYLEKDLLSYLNDVNTKLDTLLGFKDLLIKVLNLHHGNVTLNLTKNN